MSLTPLCSMSDSNLSNSLCSCSLSVWNAKRVGTSCALVLYNFWQAAPSGLSFQSDKADLTIPLYWPWWPISVARFVCVIVYVCVEGVFLKNIFLLALFFQISFSNWQCITSSLAWPPMEITRTPPPLFLKRVYWCCCFRLGPVKQWIDMCIKKKKTQKTCLTIDSEKCTNRFKLTNFVLLLSLVALHTKCRVSHCCPWPLI